MRLLPPTEIPDNSVLPVCVEADAVGGTGGKSFYVKCTQIVHYAGTSHLKINDRSLSDGASTTR